MGKFYKNGMLVYYNLRMVQLMHMFNKTEKFLYYKSNATTFYIENLLFILCIFALCMLYYDI